MLPQLFEGGTAHVLGGGPSLTRELCAELPAESCIACNSTIKLKPTAAVLYFSDYKWFRTHRPIFDQYRGHVVTASVRAKKVFAMDKHFHLVRPPTIPMAVTTSGHCAVDVAAAMGAKRIILHGFDCRTVEGRSHCHDDYAMQWSDSLYRERILPMWKGWRERMERRGVTVLNATPGSAIDEFERVNLAAVAS